MSYFDGLTTIESIKRVYRKLAFSFHPDRKNGSTEEMKIINVEYHKALKALNGNTTMGSDNKNHTYSYDQKIEQSIIDMINQLIALNMKNVEISLIGVWIWITGDTKQYKEELKKLKCKWHSKRKCWFFQDGTKKTRWNKKASLNDLANSYGYSNFNTNKSINGSK